MQDYQKTARLAPLGVCAVMWTLIGASPAWAGGTGSSPCFVFGCGTGGDGNGDGGGGAGYNSWDNGNPADATTGDGGVGGSGGGSYPGPAGGSGGLSGSTVTTDGTVSGTITGAAGAPGSPASGSGAGAGGGGGGGGLVIGSGLTVTTTGPVSGGAGGVGGGDVASHPGYAGGGGGGGAGLLLGAGTALTNSGSISGGAGGAGGDGTYNGGGGGGGDGIVATDGGTLVNSGTISGGTGGADGVGNYTGSGGGGGAGVVGANLDITNSGTISGGLSGDGLTQAEAITFTGGTNSLTLESGSSIIGNVVAVAGGHDTLALGGSADSSFDLSLLGSQYLNFVNFEKTGTSTWSLTGTDASGRDWTVSGGTLKGSTDNLQGDIATSSGAKVEFDQATDGTYAGDITGSGGLVKSGTGTLTLTGTNSYAGGTTVSSGYLVGDTGSLQGNIDIAGSSGTTFVQNTNGTYAGVLSGSGLFDKGGVGRLVLTGDSSGFAGQTLVIGGTLEVGDTVHAGAKLGGSVLVEDSAVLAGHGTLTGDLYNTAGGIVAPGGSAATGSIGTLHVGGNYSQVHVSPFVNVATLRIAVSPTAASQLAVGGTADLGGGNLSLVFTPGIYQSRSYTIVTAVGGLGGSTFGTVTQSGVTGLDPRLSYTATDALLSITGNGSFSVAPSNGQIIGSTSVSMVQGAQAANRALFGHLSDRRGDGNGGDDNLRTAFAGSNPNQVAFGGDLAGLNAVLASLPEALAQQGGWFRATGGFGSIDGSGGVPGVYSHGGGFMAGYDYQLTDHVLLGAAVGYSRTQVEQDDGSSSTINTPRVTVYGSYQLGSFALDGSLGYGYDRIKTDNVSDGGVASSQHDAHEIVAGLQASYAVDLPQKVALTPRAGLDYLHLFEEGFKESGATGFDLTSESGDMDSLRPFVGVSVSREFVTDGGTKLTPQLDLTYSREVLDNGRNAQVLVGGGAFTVAGVKPSRDQLILGVSLTASLTQSFDLFGGYTALLPVGNTISHNFEAGLRVTF